MKQQVGVLSSLEARLVYLATRRYRVRPGAARELARTALQSPATGPELIRRFRSRCRDLPPRRNGVAGGRMVLGELAGLDASQREALWLVLRERPREFC